jgi:membrane protease YdiL (CAAX protease family)
MPVLSVYTAKLSGDEHDVFSTNKRDLFISNGLMLIISSLLIITDWNVTNRSWTSLGFDYIVWDNTVAWLCGLIFIMYFIDLIYSILTSKFSKSNLGNLKHYMPLNRQEFIPFIFLAFAAGICEEIIFRGFLITYLRHYFENFPNGLHLSVMVPAMVFSVSHFYQGWLSVLKIFGMAILFGYIFVYSQSLILVICIHILIDLISGYAGVIFYKDE